MNLKHLAEFKRSLNRRQASSSALVRPKRLTKWADSLSFYSVALGLSCGLSGFLVFQVAFASNSPRGAVYPATIDDGTPRAIRSHTNTDGDSAEDHISARPRRIKQTKLPTTTRAKKEQAADREMSPLSEYSETQPVQAAPPATPTIKAADGHDTLSANPTVNPELEDLKKSNWALNQRIAHLEAAQAAPQAQEARDGQKGPQSDLQTPRTAGEKIPENKIADIAERLKYANDIVKRFGIAYDYRVMTVTDFKRILVKLESQDAELATQTSPQAEN